MKFYNLIKKFSLLVFIISISFSAFSQEDEKEELINLGADLTSRYVWRGLQLGGASVQPFMELSFKNFTFGTWGSYSFTGTQTSQEADLYLSYSFADMFSILISDYFLPDDLGGYDYFDFDADNTGHIIEAALSFDGTETIPISLLLATNVYGADARKENGDMVFSTYVELGYATTIVNTDFSAFVGGALNAPGEFAGVKVPGYYGNTDAAIINFGVSGSKSVEITDKFSLPINSSLIFNPDSKSVFLTFGISI